MQISIFRANLCKCFTIERHLLFHAIYLSVHKCASFCVRANQLMHTVLEEVCKRERCFRTFNKRILQTFVRYCNLICIILCRHDGRLLANYWQWFGAGIEESGAEVPNEVSQLPSSLSCVLDVIWSWSIFYSLVLADSPCANRTEMVMVAAEAEMVMMMMRLCRNNLPKGSRKEMQLSWRPTSQRRREQPSQ